jgi:3-oxoacyl-[acyl-carrier protein] reductase
MFFITLHTAPTLPDSAGRTKITAISEKIIVNFNPERYYNESMEKVFSGRHALVIGGSGGIGRAVAMGLAEQGAGLTIHGGTSQSRLEETLRDVRAAGSEAGGFLYPIDGPDAPERLLAQAAVPDILVCAWGPFLRGNIEEVKPETWYFLMEKNISFPGAMISLVINGMIKRRWGRILLFGGSNTDTIRGFTTTAAYSAAKTALGVIAKSVAKAAGPYGVTCNVICPGLTDTEYTDEVAKNYNRERNPDGKVLNPEHVARVALNILKNPQVNGAIIPVDWGLVV